MDYTDFLESKRHSGKLEGFAPLWMPKGLFGFQEYLVDWDLRHGRGATLADCGLGKTRIQLTVAENIVRKTAKPVLLTTPLAISLQTLAEAETIGVQAIRSRDGKVPSSAQVVVTNYEKLHLFDPSQFSGMVCDESSAIKNFDGKRKELVTEFMKRLPYRQLYTATAAPNDYTELGTSSEALGELGHIDMLNRFFVNDQNTSDTKLLKRSPISQGGPRSAGWRFKGHAETAFWRWVCSWARAMRKPSDLGFSDEGFNLPKLITREHVVETRTLAEGMLFALPAMDMRAEREERRRTMPERCEMAAQLVSGTGNPAAIWCHLNDEGNLLEELISGSKQIAGKTPDEEKEELFAAFASGQLKDLIIKDKIGAWGLNWQHCNHVVRFATHSYEAHYQAVRRCWRFGQKRDVTVDIVSTEGEQRVVENLQHKSVQADRMFTQLVAEMNDAMKIDNAQNYPEEVCVPSWL